MSLGIRRVPPCPPCADRTRRQAFTECNIRDGCAVRAAADQVPNLIAMAQSVESDDLEWVRQSRSGIRRLGDLHSTSTYRAARTFRIHEPIVIPGIVQTDAYIRRMLAFWYTYLGAPDDTDAPWL